LLELSDEDKDDIFSPIFDQVGEKEQFEKYAKNVKKEFLGNNRYNVENYNKFILEINDILWLLILLSIFKRIKEQNEESNCPDLEKLLKMFKQKGIISDKSSGYEEIYNEIESKMEEKKKDFDHFCFDTGAHEVLKKLE
ncbi:MAG: hypothetical protein MHPSP_002446, partial [Paramarteilia canceri]